MNEKMVKNQPGFETESRYAIIAGWLIIPAIMILFNLTTVMYVVLTFNPADLASYDLFIYITDFVLAFFYLFIIYTWIKRKRILSKLMIASYTIDILLYLPVIISGAGIDWIYILFNAVLIGYFIRSKRVKATFVN